MTTLAVSLGRPLMTRSHLGAALRDGAFRALTRTPGIRHAVLQGRYRPPARYKRGLLVGSFSRRSSVGRLFPQPDVRTFDGELPRLDDITGTGWRIFGWEAAPSTALSPRGRHLAQNVLRAKLVTLCVDALSRPALLERCSKTSTRWRADSSADDLSSLSARMGMCTQLRAGRSSRRRSLCWFPK